MKRNSPKGGLYRRAFALRSRRGVGLIEVMIAMVVMTIGMLGTAGMMLQIARRATQLSTQTGRAATETQQLNRLAALPYDQLSNAAGCTKIPTDPFPHTRCISVIDATGYKSIRLIITPSNGRLRGDTTFLTRSP